MESNRDWGLWWEGGQARHWARSASPQGTGTDLKGLAADSPRAGQGERWRWGRTPTHLPSLPSPLSEFQEQVFSGSP